MTDFELDPICALFPQLAEAELSELASDIKRFGQLEPILLYEGKIIDGRNRLLACKLAGVPPWTMPFEPSKARMTAQQYAISANLRHRHLSVGQMSAIVVELSEQLEREGVRNTRDALAANLPQSLMGRPKMSLTLAAEMVGLDERRGRDARAVKTASLEVFSQLKRGVINLHEAMVAIQPPEEVEPPQPANDHPKVSSTEADEAVPEIPAGDQPEAEPAFGAAPLKPVATKPGPAKPAETVRPPPSAAVLTKASNRILAVCGKSFQAEVRGRLAPEESVQFSKLTDAEMLKVKTLMLRGWVFLEALRDVIDELEPDDNIRALHSRAVQAGGRLKTTVAGFVHVVVLEDRAQELEERLKGW
jgi:hypothetical protein